MKESKLPTLQKIIACFFALVFIASIIFIGYRIYSKPAYEAHEKEQARLLAISAVSLFSEKTSKYPGIWAKFESNETELMIDHMRIMGNWVVKVNFINKGSHIDVLSSVSSGWNSRSPQSAEIRAKIFNDGSMEFEDGDTASTSADRIKIDRLKTLGKIHNFRFPDEQKKVPVLIDAEEFLFTDPEGNEFLVLKDPLIISQDILPTE